MTGQLHYRDEMVELWHGDARRVSEFIEPGSVDLIVTSPPYFALRSYRDGGEHYDGQIGSEATPGEFIDALIACTAEWCKVLRRNGSMFVNLGDKRSQRVAIRHSSHQDGLFPDRPELAKDWKRDKALGLTRMPYQNVPAAGAPPIREKSRMLLPHRYAIACEDRLGLIVRSDLVWSKPNGLPESVTDRCRDSHEYVFHLTRQGRYYSAIDEVREPHTGHTGSDSKRAMSSNGGNNHRALARDPSAFNPLGKVPGSVWTIPSEPLVVPEHLGVDHFATFPSELPRRCILGWSPPGYCLDCGEPRRAVVAREFHGEYNANEGVRQRNRSTMTGGTATVTLGRTDDIHRTITGYACGDGCPATAPTRPAVVLDPFAGTGTTLAVAKALGRRGIGVDLSRDYLRLAEWRCQDDTLRRKVRDRTGLATPAAPAIDGQLGMFGAAS